MAGIIKVNQYQDFNGNTLFTSDGNGNLTTMKTNYPAFEAFLGSNQSVSDGVETKIQFNTENFDTDNCYDNSTNYRFTPNVAGKYFVYCKVECDSAGSNSNYRSIAQIRKNGSEVGRDYQFPSTAASSNIISVSPNRILDMNGTTDYVEIFGVIHTTGGVSGEFLSGNPDLRTWFGAYRIGS